MKNTALINKKIVVVEDDEACRALFELVLEGAGCSFVIVNNGWEAVSQVRPGKFDVVLMDLRMPVMNGYEAASAIRAIDKDVPVIAMTAHARAWEDGQCQACGMNDYLIKPFDESQLLEKIRKWTEK